MTAADECQEVLEILRQRFRKFNGETKVKKTDLNRIFAEDWWPRAFLSAYHNDVDVTYAVIIECLKWRNSFGVNNISLLELKPLLDKGLAYIHGKDCNGSSILWINMRQHIIGQRNTDKLIIYWLERHTMELQAAPITMLFDMSSCSLQNMDLDLIKFILRSCKYYYPSSLTSLLIFETPSLLKASWMLLRTWMSPEMQHLLQQVERSSLSGFIPSLYIPVHYGGKDNFVFKIDHLASCMQTQSLSNNSNDNHQHILQNGSTNSDETINDKANFDNFAVKKTVKFEENGGQNIPLTSTTQRATSVTRRSVLPLAIKPLAEARLNASAENYAKIKFLSICPREELIPKQVNGESDLLDVVVLKNQGVKNVAYKIKITSPEKFRVRPSTGTIAPGAAEFIRVYLQNEYRNSVLREKFLLMAVETTGENDFGDAWKNSGEDARIEHRLRCRLITENEMAVSGAGSLDSTTTGNINDQSTNTVALVKTMEAQATYRQNIIMISMGFIIILQLLSLIWQHRYFTTIMDEHKKSCFKSDTPPNNPSFFDPEL